MDSYNDFPLYPPVFAVMEYDQYGDKGKIRPVAFDNDGEFSPIGDVYAEFPNHGLVWVSSEYGYIKNNFQEDELFWIPIQRQNYEAPPEKDQYWATGGEAERIQQHGLYPVLQCGEIPDVSSPYILGSVGEAAQALGQIFLEAHNTIYGPFNVSKDESDRFQIIALELHHGNKLGLETDHIFKIDVDEAASLESLLSFEANGSVSRLLKVSGDFLRHEFKQEDFVSDDKLLNWALKNIKLEEGKRAAKTTINSWKTALSEIKTFTGNNEARRQRLIKVVETIESYEGFGPTVRDAILNNKTLLESYFSESREIILKDELANLKEKAAEEYRKEQKEFTELRLELEEKKRVLTTDVDTLQREKAEIEKQNEESRIAHLEEEEKKTVERLESVKDKVSKWCEKEDIVIEIEELKRVRDGHKFNVEELEKKQRKLKKITPDDLIESETKEWLRRGGYGLFSSEVAKISPKSIETVAVEDAKQYVSEVRKRLYKNNRVLDFDDVANILITLQDSFLTVFVGPPGCGKTTMVYLLANALGIERSFLPISVARGWASQRDILGFFNPINANFQEAKTGLYSFLHEQQSLNSKTLSMVLLDEANLSPIEHYWSEFLPMSDPDPNILRTIQAGSSNSDDDIVVGEQVRFVATVNNDNTTERLSPRLINRAAILALPEIGYAEKVNSELPFSGEGGEDQYFPVSYENFSNLLRVTGDDDISLTEAEDNRFKNIYNALSEEDDSGAQPISISPRKVRAVVRYCHIANSLFDNAENALDYAVVQHILPTVEGFGEPFGKRLRNVLDAIGRMPKSKAVLKAIIEKGESAHHSYSFFM